MIKIQTYDCETKGVDMMAFIAKHKLEPELTCSLINIFNGTFDEATVTMLQNSPDVAFIAEDPVMHSLGAYPPENEIFKSQS
ncbi:hypothetical protein BD779DRAFT_1568349 [Infundibulicybe gibba]|nr:hypothetical protein BD779DRAFT_1568349 [Infundibulicybe gibba]